MPATDRSLADVSTSCGIRPPYNLEIASLEEELKRLTAEMQSLQEQVHEAETKVNAKLDDVLN